MVKKLPAKGNTFTIGGNMGKLYRTNYRGAQGNTGQTPTNLPKNKKNRAIWPGFSIKVEAARLELASATRQETSIYKLSHNFNLSAIVVL